MGREDAGSSRSSASADVVRQGSGALRAGRRFPDGDGVDVLGNPGACRVATPRCPASSSCSRVSRCIRPSSGSAHRVHRESASATVRVAAIRGTSRCSATRTSGPSSSGSSIRWTVGRRPVTPPFDHPGVMAIKPGRDRQRRADAVRTTERSVDAGAVDRETTADAPSSHARRCRSAVRRARGRDVADDADPLPVLRAACGISDAPETAPQPSPPPISRSTGAGCAPRAGPSADLLDHPDRLTHPARPRTRATDQPAASRRSWEDALDRIVTAIKETQAGTVRTASAASAAAG